MVNVIHCITMIIIANEDDVMCCLERLFGDVESFRKDFKAFFQEKEAEDTLKLFGQAFDDKDFSETFAVKFYSLDSSPPPSSHL